MNSVAKPTELSPGTEFGELMECLMRQRGHYDTEEEFRAFAIGEVRRFITDLRGLEIEIALRPIHSDRQRTLS